MTRAPNCECGTIQGELLLVRHTQIAEEYQGICYGDSDVPLSIDGEGHALKLAISLAGARPALVVHSGLRRSRFMADEVARLAGAELVCDPRLREMNFGAWELRSWDAIFADVGHTMSRLIHEPETICAEGAESANAVRNRMLAWAGELIGGQIVVAISHGGAISALRGALEGIPSSEWPEYMPSYGEVTRLSLPVSFDVG